jgi:hypothetical protein
MRSGCDAPHESANDDERSDACLWTETKSGTHEPYFGGHERAARPKRPLNARIAKHS